MFSQLTYHEIQIGKIALRMLLSGNEKALIGILKIKKTVAENLRLKNFYAFVD